jgi:hypothetical protein
MITVSLAHGVPSSRHGYRNADQSFHRSHEFHSWQSEQPRFQFIAAAYPSA